MYHCDCPTCRLNGYQGRSFIEYNMQRYCTAHPVYLTIKRYKQALARMGAPESAIWSERPIQKPVIAPVIKKKEMDTYVLSFRDRYGVEQDWFIKSDDDEDASNQAMHVMKNLPFLVTEFTLVKEVHVNFVRLLNR